MQSYADKRVEQMRNGSFAISDEYFLEEYLIDESFPVLKVFIRNTTAYFKARRELCLIGAETHAKLAAYACLQLLEVTAKATCEAEAKALVDRVTQMRNGAAASCRSLASLIAVAPLEVASATAMLHRH